MNVIICCMKYDYDKNSKIALGQTEGHLPLKFVPVNIRLVAVNIHSCGECKIRKYSFIFVCAGKWTLFSEMVSRFWTVLGGLYYLVDTGAYSYTTYLISLFRWCYANRICLLKFAADSNEINVFCLKGHSNGPLLPDAANEPLIWYENRKSSVLFA